MAAAGNKRHPVPGDEPDIFQNPLEVPCFRRTALWTIGTSTAGFLLSFQRHRSIPRALNIMIPLGVASSCMTWILCRREWSDKHARMRTVQQIRELSPKVVRYGMLGEDDWEEKMAIRRELAEKMAEIKAYGIDLDDPQVLNKQLRAALHKLEAEVQKDEHMLALEASSEAASRTDV
eukprot:INCI9805.1.p2 GENE.INCI9805.1~~INCI9805.1.p2  ORF type:complete len:177 (+),score=34.89 INCI9805.1:114-644(+)